MKYLLFLLTIFQVDNICILSQPVKETYSASQSYGILTSPGYPNASSPFNWNSAIKSQANFYLEINLVECKLGRNGALRIVEINLNGQGKTILETSCEKTNYLKTHVSASPLVNIEVITEKVGGSFNLTYRSVDFKLIATEIKERTFSLASNVAKNLPMIQLVINDISRNFTVIDVIGNSTSWEFSDMNPNTDYEISWQRIVDNNPQGEKQFLLVTTLDDVPTAARDLYYDEDKRRSEQNITLRWTGPDYMNGLFQYYNVSCKSKISSYEISTTELIIKIGNLEPATAYNCTVSAVNNIGQGEESNTVFVLTKDGYSNPVENYQFTQISSREINLSWQQPSLVRGTMIYYAVFVYKVALLPSNNNNNNDAAQCERVIVMFPDDYRVKDFEILKNLTNDFTNSNCSFSWRTVQVNTALEETLNLTVNVNYLQLTTNKYFTEIYPVNGAGVGLKNTLAIQYKEPEKENTKGLNVSVVVNSLPSANSIVDIVSPYVVKLLEERGHSVSIYNLITDTESEIQEKTILKMENSDAFVILSPDYSSIISPESTSRIDQLSWRDFAYRPVGLIVYSMGSADNGDKSNLTANSEWRLTFSEVGGLTLPSVIELVGQENGTLEVTNGETKALLDLMFNQLEFVGAGMKWYTKAQGGHSNVPKVQLESLFV